MRNAMNIVRNMKQITRSFTQPIAFRKSIAAEHTPSRESLYTIALGLPIVVQLRIHTYSKFDLLLAEPYRRRSDEKMQFVYQIALHVDC